MGKKTRLDEVTVRRFMKLAELDRVVAETFFNEEEDEEVPMEEPAAEEVPVEDPADAEEPAADGEAGPAEVEMAERVASAVMVALEDELGVSTDVAVPEEGGEEPAAEELPGEEEIAPEEELPMEERIVNEVTRRVAQRLLKLKKTKRKSRR